MSEVSLFNENIILSQFKVPSDVSLSALDYIHSSRKLVLKDNIESLVSRSQSGEGEAFAALYNFFSWRVYRYIQLRVGRPEQAEDITQEVFLKALQNIGSYRDEGKSFISWLLMIAHNLVIDYYRQSNKNRCVPLIDTLISVEDPAFTAEQMMRVSEIKQAIETLPPRQKEIIKLRFESERTVAETALLTSITEGSVKKLQHEAILKLKRQMEKNTQNTPCRVSGLFLDYDGTISHSGVPRQQSRISPGLERLLYSIRKVVPIGIITTKDLSFVLPRTPFARAWSAIAGLEMKIESRLTVSQEVRKALPELNKALNYALQNIRWGGMIEKKCDPQGQPLAFCVDWRHMRRDCQSQLAISRTLDYCRNLNLKVVEYPGNPYFDVFPCAISKGKALRKLKDDLKIFGNILYMGDSIMDNQAFREADISIGVAEDKKPVGLKCSYWLRFDEVPHFLSSLHDNRLTFSPDLPGIKPYSL
jgi:RNA polymerase sigma factor (sigma-70 family)